MHVHCPLCEGQIEFDVETRFGDLTCPACGGDFGLISDDDFSVIDPDDKEVRTVDRFTLIEPAGQGGFGTVWKAHDPDLDRTVAIKIPHPHRMHNADAAFTREARAAAQLRHPNIVGVHEVRRDGETCYIVSDFVDGPNLKAWKDGRPLPAGEAARMCVKIADALHHAHECGVIHRDLKPSNILLDQSGEPHIADFGIAKRESGDITATREGAILGTPAYMSPEQATGDAHRADCRSDVYSLGVILFELLTGELPFRGDPRMVVAQVINDDPPRLRRLNDLIPHDLETICLKSLEKNPDHRYSTADDLAQELGRFLRGEPILARPISAIAQCWRWCRAKPALATMSGLAAVLLFLVVGVSISYALYQSRAGTRLRREQQQTRSALTEAKSQRNLAQEQRREAVRLSASLALDRGIQLCEQGKVSRGLLWLARCLQISSDENLEFERAARSNLSAWLPETVAEPTTFLRHKFTVWAAAYSPDGTRLVTGCTGGTLNVWNVADGLLVSQPFQHADAVRAVEFSRDGSMFASASRDGTARIWDATTLEPVGMPLRHPRDVRAVAFYHDGSRCVTGCADGAVRIWDAKTTELIDVPIRRPAPINSVAVSRDGTKLLAGSSDHQAILWDIVKAKPIGAPLQHEAFVSSVTFSPDGVHCATASWDRTAQIWNAETTEPVGSPLVHEAPVRSVAFSPDGRLVLTGGDDQSARIWDVSTSRPSGALLEHQASIRTVAFSPKGDSVVTTSGTFARVWKIAPATAETTRSLNHPDYVYVVSFSPNGKHLLTGSEDATARLWDADRGIVVRTFDGHQAPIYGAVMSPDGHTVLTGSNDKTARLWNADTGKPIAEPMKHAAAVFAVAFSGDGKYILTGSDDGMGRIWDAVTTRPLSPPLQHRPSGVRTVAFTPDNSQALTISGGGDSRIWHVPAGEPTGWILEHSGTSVYSASFTQDGARLLTGTAQNHAVFWNIATRKPTGPTFRHQGPVRAAALSPDGHTVLTGSDDNTARWWDAVTGKPIGPPMRHQREVGSVDFSPDGSRAVTGSPDKTARIWSVPRPLAGDVQSIVLRVQRLTGMQIDEDGAMQTLPAE